MFSGGIHKQNWAAMGRAYENIVREVPQGSILEPYCLL